MLTGKQCTGRRKIIIQGIFGKLIRNPGTVTFLSLFSEGNTASRKEKYVGLEVKGKGPKGFCPLSCTDMNIALCVDRVWQNCRLGTNSGALPFKMLWPGHMPVCLHTYANVKTTVFQLERRMEIMPLLVVCTLSAGVEQEAVNREL